MTKNTKAYIALPIICIIGGTIYLGIRMAGIKYPAFLTLIIGVYMVQNGYRKQRAEKIEIPAITFLKNPPLNHNS